MNEFNPIQVHSGVSVLGRGFSSTIARSAVNTKNKRTLNSAIYDSHKRQYEVIQEREQRCLDDSECRESRIFYEVFYNSVIRKEFAFGKVREFLSHLRESEIYKHEIKKSARNVQAYLAKWDINVSRLFKGYEGTLDTYDDLMQEANKYFTPLYNTFYYTVLQVLTDHDVPHRPIVAEIEAACMVTEFAYKKMFNDIDAAAMASPTVQRFEPMCYDRVFPEFEKLRSLIVSKYVKNASIDLNKIPSTNTAGENLLRALGSGQQVLEICNRFFESLKMRNILTN